MALAPLLYNITFDSQTRILYFWDKEGHEIYHCEIPSPAPALPTVSMVISYIRKDKSRYYTSGGTYYLYDDSGNPIPWDSINKYQFFGTYESDSSTTIASGEFYQRYQSIIESCGVVNYKNTGLGLYVQRVVFYLCSSPDTAVVTVYDSSNNQYNAFKYTSDGTDYYYVLDGTQTDWTDDLSSIGYRLWNLKVYGQNGNSFSLNTENNFMYVENGGTYSMLNGGTASTVWEIFGIYDSNGNELSHESDYIWWINASNIYYKASPTRSVSVAYALLIVKPPIS